MERYTPFFDHTKFTETFESHSIYKEQDKPPYRSYKGNTRFVLFNKLLFNNKIPSEYKVVFKELESFSIGGRTNPFTKEILLNKNRFPHEILDVILIHEMIHAYLCSIDTDKHLKDPHGKDFMRVRNKIMSKFPEYEIPIKETLQSILMKKA